MQQLFVPLAAWPDEPFVARDFVYQDAFCNRGTTVLGGRAYATEEDAQKYLESRQREGWIAQKKGGVALVSFVRPLDPLTHVATLDKALDPDRFDALMRFVPPMLRNARDPNKTLWKQVVSDLTMHLGKAGSLKILQAVQIDALHKMARLYPVPIATYFLTNPANVKKVDGVSVLLQEKAAARIVYPYPKPRLPQTACELEESCDIAPKNLRRLGALAVYRGMWAQGAFYLKQAKTLEGTLEEFIGFRVAAALGACVPQVGLVFWRGNPMLVSEAIPGELVFDFCKTALPFQQTRAQENMDQQLLYGAMLNHQDMLEHNFLTLDGAQVCLIDMGGSLRRNNVGNSQPFSLAAESVGRFLLKHGGALSVADKAACLAQMAQNLPKVEKALRDAAATIADLGLSLPAYSAQTLMAEIYKPLESCVRSGLAALVQQRDLVDETRARFTRPAAPRPDVLAKCASF